MVVEFCYGWWTNSLGLISDSFHMLFDSMALAIGLFASVIKHWGANTIFTYGYGRVQVLSGFVNGIFLCFISASVFCESIKRLFQPQDIITEKLFLVSVIGFCVNLVGLIAFHDQSHSHTEHSHIKKEKNANGHSDGHNHNHHGHKSDDIDCHDDNLYGVFIHILADALGSIGVMVSSLLMWLYDWKRADPLCSLMISILIGLSVIPLLRQTAPTLLQRTPKVFQKKYEPCFKKLEELPGLKDWSEPHFWSLTPGYFIGTINLLVEDNANEQKILADASSIFKNFGITHITIQIDKANTNGIQSLTDPSKFQWSTGYFT